MTHTNPSYFSIKISDIPSDQSIPFDIHVLINNRYILYVRNGDQLKKEKISSLAEKKIQAFHVPQEQKNEFKKFMHTQIANTETCPQEKANLLRSSSSIMLQELFEDEDVDKALKDSKEVIHQFVDFIDSEPQAICHLLSLSGHDFYTYNHSLDVSIYSLGLGKALNFDLQTMEELGTGSILHDIGKRHVPVEIICKDGPLDDQEWEKMRQHPQLGLMILNEQEGISEAVKASCFEHHESCEGNGYPQQLDADEIHPFAKIIAITDTFDAMTTQRSYNTPLSPREALELMKNKLCKRYDPEMLEAMHSVLFKLPKVG